MFYQPLNNTVIQNVGDSLKGSIAKKDFVHKFLTEKLPLERLKQGEHEDIKYKAQILDNFGTSWSKPVKKRKHRNFLTCREKRELKVFDLKKEVHKFQDYLPLHRLWQDYIRDVIDLSRLTPAPGSKATDHHLRLLKADYHGCFITVKRSKCPSLVGASGIILQETRNMFNIITKEDKIKSIPKENSVFAFELGGKLFTVHGNHFKVKASERSRKKFKSKPTTDI